MIRDRYTSEFKRSRVCSALFVLRCAGTRILTMLMLAALMISPHFLRSAMMKAPNSAVAGHAHAALSF
jgi:hypothetical protein